MILKRKKKMSDLYSASELKERLKNNDNRGTSQPYLLLLQEKRTYAAHDEFDSGDVEDKWVEFYTGSFLHANSKKDLVDALKEHYDNESVPAKAVESIRKIREGHYWQTENVFLTDLGYEEHKEVNGHNLGT